MVTKIGLLVFKKKVTKCLSKLQFINRRRYAFQTFSCQTHPSAVEYVA